jgi:hypothetical protein
MKVRTENGIGFPVFQMLAQLSLRQSQTFQKNPSPDLEF